MLQPTENGARYELASPTAMPNAGAFLWNRRMMIQVTCRGYATARFMQPEPAKYSHAPNLEAQTFMQPEQAYYAHHPGRFVYVTVTRGDTARTMVVCDGVALPQARIGDIEPGRTYRVEVTVGPSAPAAA